MTTQESILCFKRPLLEQLEAGLGLFQGLKTELRSEIKLLRDPDNLLYLPRIEAETDPTHKQLIPYVLAIKETQILCYRRNGTESRLHGLWSVGIGGHIVEEDRCQFSADRTGYYEGMLREIQEEIGFVPTKGLSPEPVAAINDDSTEVGRVHFGLVHILSVPGDRPAASFAEIQQPEFREIEHVIEDYRRKPESFESWTRLCLDHIDALLPRT